MDVVSINIKEKTEFTKDGSIESGKPVKKCKAKGNKENRIKK
jgi:hypothetical protein